MLTKDLSFQAHRRGEFEGFEQINNGGLKMKR